MSYRQIFDAAIGETPPSTIDVDRVVRRQRRAAVLRPALAAAVAVLVVAAGVAVASAVTRSDQAIPPADEVVEGFPVYHQGTRVIAAGSGQLTEELEITFVPSAPDPVVYWRCATPDPWWSSIISADRGLHATELEIRINGHLFVDARGGLECGGRSGSYTRPEVDGRAAFDLRAGEPNTLTATLTGPFTDRHGEPVRVPRGAEWGIALAEPVPFEDYPLPPRPETLPPLQVPEQGYYALLLRADPDDPNQPVEAPLRWLATSAYTAQVGSQTPGVLTLLVDGVEVGEVASWDYGGHCSGGGVGGGIALDWPALRAAGVAGQPGDEVTVTVRPEHMTGDWYLRLNRAGSLHC